MRVLITGPECTGKSTLAKVLSEQLKIPYFPEYARTYLKNNGPAYSQSDLHIIAEQHHKLVSIFPQDQSLILDTYLLNIKIWGAEKFGTYPTWIDEELKDTYFDKVLLTYPDLPWEQDGLRENPQKSKELYTKFENELKSLGWEYDVIKGVNEQRFQTALSKV